MLPRGQGALWRLLSTMSPHPFDLTQSGLSALKGFLRLHASRSAMVALHCIDAIRKLDYQPAMRWMLLDKSPPSFVRGVEIHLSFDEMALREVSLSVAAQMFDRLFAPYAPMNSYVQLVVYSHQTGEELIRCETRPGTRMLI
jgi:type VI protein secretion system component VasA